MEIKAFGRILRGPLGVAILAASLVLLWQFLTVRYNYEGKWSALFHTSPSFELPPALAGETVCRIPRSRGYDGQFYHLIAHDPLFKRGFSKYVDNPRMRWRRILLPGLSHALALGEDSRIHLCYIAVNLSFVFLGAYWLSHYCLCNHLHPACGLGFILVPAVAVSIDRATVDSALAALAVGIARYASSAGSWKTYALLALAPLARETGGCLIAGQFLSNIRSGKWAAALGALATAAPYAGWVWFVHRNTFLDATPLLSWPFAGILNRTLHPVVYPITGPWVTTAAILDYLALLGVWVALFLAARLLAAEFSDTIKASILAFAFFSLWLGHPEIWFGAYEFGRTLSPLLILTALRGISSREPWLLLPIGLVLPRIALQLQPQVFGIARGLL